MNLNDEIKNIKKNLILDFKKTKNYHELLVVKNFFIGKKSKLNLIFSKLKLEEKKECNFDFIEIKKWVKTNFEEYSKKINLFDSKKIENIKIFQKFKIFENKIFSKIFDEKPKVKNKIGSHHPLNLIINKIHVFFEKFNSIFLESNDVEEVKFNFDFLNIPEDHSSRQKTDTFYVEKEKVMRTHCTNFTARTLNDLKEYDQPKFFYTIGNVYRNDVDDQTHTHQFMQLDGCLIGKDYSIANLKWILKKFVEFLFDNNKKIRFRTNAFPFTVPSIEIDLECWICKKQKECSVCKNTGWIEILGGGIIAPEVLKKCSLNEEITVLAFGVGIERLAMLKYGFLDIRNFYKNNFARK